MAQISRIYDFEDGQVLTEAQLDAEFNQLVSTINSLDNDNIAATANISPAKISSTIKGSAIARDAGTGALSAKPDNIGIEISGDALALKNSGVTTARIADDAVTVDKIANNAVTSDQLASNAVTTAKIADGAVTQAKRASLNLVQSGTNINFSTSSTSFVAVTNASISFTSTGRPVMIGVKAFNSSGPSLNVESSDPLETIIGVDIQMRRDGTAIANFTLNNTGAEQTAITVPGTTIMHIDSPAAGTYTYDLRIKGSASSGTPTARLQNAQLFAYEL